jgi:hypothetical protein
MNSKKIAIWLSALLTVGASVLVAPSAHAYGNDWDWCDSITVNSNSNTRTAKVRITGICDGGSVSVTGTMNRRSGSLNLRGYIGQSRVKLGASINRYTSFNGYIDGYRVKVEGSGNNYSCDLDQWVERSFEPVMQGNFFNRICPILNGLR